MEGDSPTAISPAYDQALGRIKSAGLRDTAFRRRLIRLLIAESPRALSVEEIHEHPITNKADLVTVYRNVDTLIQIALLKRLTDESGKSFYKLNVLQEPSLSITCRNCHSVHDAPLSVHSQLETLARSYGYSNLTSRCEVIGCCEECARKEEI